MTRPPTYRGLLDQAQALLDQTLDGPIETTGMTAGRARLVSVVARHTDFLVDTFHECRSRDHAIEFADGLNAFRPSMECYRPMRGEPWHDAAELVGLAHDLFATHIGPDRQRLSPFVPAFDDDAALRYALARIGQVALLATAGRHGFHDSYRQVLASVRQPAYELLVRLGPTPVARSLATLEPRMLALPALDDDPYLAATDTVRYLRQLLHRQVHGLEPSTLGTVRSTVMVAFLAHEALLRQPGRRHEPAVVDARARLGRLGAQLSARPMIAPRSPQLREATSRASALLRALDIPAHTDPATLARVARDLAGDIEPVGRHLPPTELAEHRWAGLGRRRWVPANTAPEPDRAGRTLP
jgi:hypothetical protein